MTTIQHWIDGRLTSGEGQRTAPVANPATGEKTADVLLADGIDVERAVSSARLASKAWRQASLSHRSNILFAFRELLRQNASDLAALITAEQGKTLADATGEVMRGLENVEFASGVPHLLKGGFSEGAARGVDVHSVRQPLGVVAGITPFNFPAMVPLWMCANAIACGNAFILKPSEKDPSASLLIAELWKQAGLPDGVFTVLQGDKVAVDGLLAHREVAAVSFVGSTPIAKYIYETGTAAGKRVQALGGAKNHALILPDADTDVAADALVSAAYGAAGERCMALSVAVVVGGAAGPFLEAVSARLDRLKVGDGSDPESDMGPLITAEHRDRVAQYVDEAETDGAVVLVDGRKTSVPDDGFFLGPTLLDDVTAGMAVYRDEIFGPVLCVVRVPSYEAGLELINSNEYANGTAIFTRDGGAARQFQYDVEVGMVGVNVPIPVPVAYYSFGGWKSSLFGDTNMYGPEGIQFYTRGKVVTSRWPAPSESSVDLGFPRNR